MAWIKLDDGIMDNPKVAQLGPLAFGLYIASIVYAARNLTDGRVPWAAAQRLVPTRWMEDERALWTLGASSGQRQVDDGQLVQMAIRQLVVRCLWDEDEDGYIVHDFLDYQPSREQVVAERKAVSAIKRAAGRRGADARWNGTRGKPMADTMANGWHGDGPDPDPDPDPDPKKAPPTPADVDTVLRHLNAKAGKAFRVEAEASRKFVTARLRSGMTVADLCAIVDVKVRAWLGDPKMAEYLRPSTLFNAEKAEAYLAEAKSPPVQSPISAAARARSLGRSTSEAERAALSAQELPPCARCGDDHGLHLRADGSCGVKGCKCEGWLAPARTAP